jgi:hypothetical protein
MSVCLLGLFTRQLLHLAACLADSCPQQLEQLTDSWRPPTALSHLRYELVNFCIFCEQKFAVLFLVLYYFY